MLGRQMMESLGIPEERIALIHNAVDNDWWISASCQVDRAAIRASLHIDNEAHFIVFYTKLQPRKRPLDLLFAFAEASIPDSVLLIVGEGPSSASLKAEAITLGLGDRVRFLGFIHQSKFPAIYTAAELMVLLSEYAPFAMVVDAAMLCGCPVMVSDRVGAARGPVAPVTPDFIFLHCEVAALARKSQRAFADPARLNSLRHAVRAHMDVWSSKDNVAAVLCTIECAYDQRHRTLNEPLAQAPKPGIRSGDSHPIR